MSARREWTVRADEGTTVGDILERMSVEARAIDEARVFIGRKRARAASEPVRVGDVVSVARSVEATVEARVLHEDSDLLALDKPAGQPTIPDHSGGAHSLLHAAARAARMDPSSLHPTSRLDRDVSGVVVFAKTARAAERLREARDRGAYHRRYVAIASGLVDPREGSWNAPIGRAPDPRRRAAFGRDAAPALTRYRVVAEAGRASLLVVEPETGRTHQIRVHASHAGAPLFGDTFYRGPTRFTVTSGPRAGRVLAIPRVALHAARVTVPGPRGAPIVVSAEIPDDLRDLWEALGGDGAAWDTALSCAPLAP